MPGSSAIPTGASACSVGDLILVVDIGGGTTDFTLIAVTESEGELSLNRVAVGEHILLGGDNIDLALAGVVAHRLAEKGTRIDSRQHQQLWANCRRRQGKTARARLEGQGTAGHDPRQGHRTGRRHDQGVAAALRYRAGARRRLSARLSAATICPPYSAASACRNSDCLMRPIRRSRGIWRASCASRPQRRSRAGAARTERARVPDARAVQRRRAATRSSCASGFLSTLNSWLARGRHAAGEVAERRGSDARRFARRRLLRPGAAAAAAFASAAASRGRITSASRAAMPVDPGLPRPAEGAHGGRRSAWKKAPTA